VRARLALIASAAVGAGVVAVRRLRRRPAFEAEGVAEDPADELRRRLDDARPAAAEEAPEAEAPAEAVEERRRQVHEQAQAAADEMRRAANSP
jgi:hypothetical protein